MRKFLRKLIRILLNRNTLFVVLLLLQAALLTLTILFLSQHYLPVYAVLIALDVVLVIYITTTSENPSYKIPWLVAILVLPLFADFRYDWFDLKITPFIECRAGYAATDDEYNNYSGCYFSPSVGVRVWKFNLAFGTEYVKLHRPWRFLEIVDGHRQITTVELQASYIIKLSYEWGGNF